MTTASVVEAFLALPHGLPARLHHGRRDYPPSRSSMGTHWALLQYWLAVGGGTTPFSTCSPGALHVDTHAGSSVACHRFEGAT